MSNCLYDFGFIGCGNMGGALAGAVARAINPNKIAVCDFDEKKTDALVEKYGVRKTDIQTLAKESAFIVLGVKPQVMADTLARVSSVLK